MRLITIRTPVAHLPLNFLAKYVKKNPNKGIIHRCIFLNICCFRDHIYPFASKRPRSFGFSCIYNVLLLFFEYLNIYRLYLHPIQLLLRLLFVTDFGH